jgi:hypothetical protein
MRIYAIVQWKAKKERAKNSMISYQARERRFEGQEELHKRCTGARQVKPRSTTHPLKDEPRASLRPGTILAQLIIHSVYELGKPVESFFVWNFKVPQGGSTR